MTAAHTIVTAGRPGLGPALCSMTIVVATIAPLLAEMRGASPTVRHVGDALAWLGTGMLSGSLLLTIREPLIARWFGGLGRMYRWHHVLGIGACVALLAHPVLLAAAMLPTSPARAWHLLSPTRWFPSNAMGWAALLGLMTGLAASLPKRMRYSVWRRLHLAFSLAVLLGLAHVFASRGISAGLLLASVPITLALGWRVLRVDRGSSASPYEVQSLAPVAFNTMEVTLRPLAAPITAAPGQFVMAAFFAGSNYHGCGEFHPYTVCDSRADGSLILTIKALGDCTTKIQCLEQGVAARVDGPYGQFLASRTRAPSLWIAGGIGVTPFIAKLRAEGVQAPTELIYVFRSPSAAAYLKELQEHSARQPLLRLQTLVAQEDLRPLFARLGDVQDLESREVYLSGPPAFVDAVVEELHSRGISRSQIHSEGFEFR